MSVSYCFLFYIIITIDNARCTAGSNPAASVAMTTGLSGTYLNTDHAVWCDDDDNFITKWHFCYYTQNLTTGSTLSMTLAILWSSYESVDSYEFHPRRFTRISIIHNRTLAKIFCVEHSLSREDYLPVSHGDIVGVVLPSDSPIPVIGSGETITDFLKYRSEQNLESIMYDSLTSTSAIMHVEAVIGIENSRRSENILSICYFFVETVTPLITRTETYVKSSLYTTTRSSVQHATTARPSVHSK